MVAKTPHQQAAVERLKRWALSPEGRAQVGLNGATPFRSCVAFYTGKVPEHMIDGWCAELVFEATGHHPGKQRGDKHGDG